MTQILEKPVLARVPHRFTGEQYRKMYDLGVFGFEQRSELIAGDVFFMAAMGAAHYRALRIFGKLLYRTFLDQFEIAQQAPIRLSDDTEPEPDFSIMNLNFADGVPRALDVFLAVEISDSTLIFDQKKKLPQYAQSGIPETWILNLVERQIEVYRLPKGSKYLQCQIFLTGQPVAPLFSPDSSLVWWTALSSLPTDE
jgi:Uma2 family endonuclease